VTITTEEDLKKKPATKKKAAPKKSTTVEATQQLTSPSPQPTSENLPADDSIIGKPCPLCGQGTIIKGKTAYGCSNWKGGCTYRLPFAQM